ncbi:MAG: hypothetical protein HY866_08750 [Chloroflexi bacterium]|nr:hypothetical protein [Chloroflexota bacterium]
MYLYSYQVADVVVRTESDVPLSTFWRSMFDHFPVRHDAQPDICYRFQSIDPATLTLPPLDPDNQNRLLRCRHSFLDSNLLRSPLVRERLLVCTDYPNRVYFELRPDSVNLFDFMRREHIAFFSPHLGELITGFNIHPSLYAIFLPVFSSLMLHCCGVLRNNRVALFLAADGGGKTTVGKLALSGTILSDDHVMLRNVDGLVTAFGTPWGLTVSETLTARVGGLFWLEQGDHFELIPLGTPEILRALWNEHGGYFHVLPDDYKTWAFNFFAELCSQLPAYRMCFSKDYVDWNAIDAAMK